MKIKKFGNFKLLKRIAVGGMAEIFLGCTGSVKTGYKFVVIKRVMDTQSDNKEFKKMFQNEGKVVININHSNIASIFEFGFQEDQVFICMEYISGRNLRQLIKKLHSQKRKMSIEQCIYVMRDVCLGLDYVHHCTDSETGQPLNIIHRDVSPQNIMISFSGDVKVIDFGIAKVNNSEATKSGVLKGKFEYMSPEQVRGEELDKQTDIFSLGSVFWEMLAGRKLFTGGNEIQILRLIRSCRVPDLKEINADVPDEVVRIVNKALSLKKNIRYKTMADMANDLSVCLSEQYPKFTHTHFSSFIKDVYVEEILEERQNIKNYMEFLKRDEKRLSLGSSSANYEDSTSELSTFIGQSKGKRNDPQDSTELTGVSDLSDLGIEEETSRQTLATEDASIGDITETQFHDEVEPDEDMTIRKSSASFSSLYDESISVRKSIPQWLSHRVQLKRRKIPHIKKKKTRFPFFLFISVLIGFGVGGFYFESIQTIFQKTDIGLQLPDQAVHEEQRGLASSPKNNPADTRPSNIHSPPQGIQPSVSVKSIFITTQPSGAQLFVDNNKEPEPNLTPVMIKIPIGKNIRLRITKKGYRSENRVLSSSMPQKKINISLKRVNNEPISPIILR